jgi:hypothetical protein
MKVLRFLKSSGDGVRHSGKNNFEWKDIFQCHCGHDLRYSIVYKALSKQQVSCSTISLMTMYVNLGIPLDELWRIQKYKNDTFIMSGHRTDAKKIYLQEGLSLTKVEIQRIVVKFTRLLDYQPSRIEQGLKYFEDLNINLICNRGIILRSPSLSCLMWSKLQEKMQLMCSLLGMSTEEIVQVLSRETNWLTSSPECLERRIYFLFDLGMVRAEVRSMICCHPQLLTYSLDTMQAKLRFLSSSGFSTDQIIKIFRRFAQVVSLNVHKNLNPTLKYLLEEVGISIRDITSTPSILSLSLTDRIIPRHKKLRKISDQTPIKAYHFIVKEHDFDKMTNVKDEH